MDKYFFNGWDDLLRTLVVGVLAYIALVFLLRIFGNRTLSKMNAFDLVVTVALGSILATVLLNPVALFVLLALNGVGFSLTNIAMNVEADRVEAATSARVMNTCHGAWSVGFLLTSLLGAALRGPGHFQVEVS